MLTTYCSSSETVKSAGAVNSTITRGRPSDCSGPPTALFDKNLARLGYGLDHLEKLTPPESAMGLSSFNLVTTATDFFPDEAARKARSQRTLVELLGADIQLQVEIGGGVPAEPEAIWFKCALACLIFELKNELGLGGDQFLQCPAVYGKIIEQGEVSPCFPSHRWRIKPSSQFPPSSLNLFLDPVPPFSPGPPVAADVERAFENVGQTQ